MKLLTYHNFLALLAIALFLGSCKPDEETDPPADPTPPGEIDGYGLGWFGSDDMTTTPAAVSFNFGGGDVPPAYDITDKFPPIGDQGAYGTCVSWAVGYNTKTALAGMANNLSTSDLASQANQSSPKDLFLAIPDNLKGTECNGTNFSSAFDVVQNRGIASMQTVPYTNLGSCAQSGSQSGWASEAAGNKIEYWRKIESTVDAVKQNVSKNIPVVFGARLADNFMNWNSENVLTAGDSYDNVGIHAYHAMVVAGYDDSKGPNGAFKVINSWGTSWGAVGYIWVDYNYFITEFCDGGEPGDKPLFIAADGQGGGPNPPDVDPETTGVDLAPWVFGDFSTQNSQAYNERVVDFNLYNIGAQSAAPSANWSVYYVYFDAYDASNYGVIFYDEFNTSIPDNSYDCPAENYCVFNLNLPSGSDFAYEAFGDVSVQQLYYMPQISGYYYLAMIVDAGDAFQEGDEVNNVFYTTMYPKYFEGGYSKSSNAPFKFKNDLEPSAENLRANPMNSAVNAENPNAYTTREITAFFAAEKQSGRLAAKASPTTGGNTSIINQRSN